MSKRNLVALSLAGGLGNQLYSYAAGLALARRLDGDLRFDTRYFRLSHARPEQLSAFGLKLREWTPLWWKPQRLARRWSGGRWRPGPERFQEHADFEPDFFTITAPVYLMGYFQSWRYFAPIEPEVRSAFDTGRLSHAGIAAWEHRIRSTDCAVAVHVRRGDYADYPGLIRGRDYYDRARARLEALVLSPTYYLFSDDIADASAMLAGWPNVVAVSGTSSGLDDFRLMSLCRHFIIANSTFSWWAAWLGTAVDKQVVAPSRWFDTDRTDLDARLPPQWLRA